MSATVFWMLAAVVITASVVAVGHRVLRTAVVGAMVAVLALAALYVQLGAPWLALTLLLMQIPAVLAVAIPLLVNGRTTPARDHARGVDLVTGLLLALGLAIELAWIFQRLLPAPFPPLTDAAAEAPGPFGGMPIAARSDDLLLAALGVVVLLMSLAAAQALRREGV